MFASQLWTIDACSSDRLYEQISEIVAKLMVI